MHHDAKALGAYFTPEAVADALVRWAVRSPGDLLLDPSCGDGRFVTRHPNSVGVERDPTSVAEASARAPDAAIVEDDFFNWTSADHRRFDCAVGNPPFIRYQRFNGAIRRAALDYCRGAGVIFSGLSSSWAPFIVAAASKLRAGGRIAFVVPAEIGHAPYAAPLIEYLLAHFGYVHVVAIREKIFPRLSEDCWLLFADHAGSRAEGIQFSRLESFVHGPMPPDESEFIPVDEWRGRWGGRLRPLLLPAGVRNLYARVSADHRAVRLGEIAQIGIGYVSGANEFFHLRPSEARRYAIPDEFLLPSIRNSRYLNGEAINQVDIERWIARDEPVFLLRIPSRARVPSAVPEQPEVEHEASSRLLKDNDVAIDAHGQPVASVRRFHAALRELADRRGVRDDVSRYEAIALALASTQPEQPGQIVEQFPEPDSPLRFERFFDTLYRQYDERFVYGAPDLRKTTGRKEWDGESPAFGAAVVNDVDYEPRVDGS